MTYEWIGQNIFFLNSCQNGCFWSIQISQRLNSKTKEYNKTNDILYINKYSIQLLFPGNTKGKC